MKIYKPREELRPYVRYYWVLTSDKPFSVLTFPIGCPQIIFHRKSPLYIPELDNSQSRLTISGQVNFPSHIRSDGNLEMIVAVFYPHTIGMFIDTPPSVFYNLEINGYDIDNRELNNLAGRIFDCSSCVDGIVMLEDWLVTKVRPSLNMSRVGASLERLLRTPATSVIDMADDACLSRKQYERVFRDCVGMNPKEYTRVVRFQKALRFMQCGDRDYAGIAAECGYSDQSHFIREFRNMSGYTPRSLLKCIDPYSDLYTQPV